MKLHLEKYSYRFAEQVLNSNLSVKLELEQSIENLEFDPDTLSRPN